MPGQRRRTTPRRTREYGVDALRAYALHLAGLTRDERRSQPDERWPDLVLFLGDQVYADETSPEMRGFIEERRDPEQAPWWELKDYEEYAHLYRIAWSDPANRWLLSTLPTAMIFDDHDIRDDWNASHTWRSEMADTTWWHDRIVGGLASYWVYQHLGNLAPEVRAADALWRRVAEHRGEEELDLSEALDDHAATARRRSHVVPLELHPRASAPRPGWWWWTRAPHGCSTPIAARCWTSRSSPGWTSSCAETSTTC